MSRRGLTQYQIDHQENIMLINSHWPDEDRDEDWDDEEEVFEEDDIEDY